MNAFAFLRSAFSERVRDDWRSDIRAVITGIVVIFKSITLLRRAKITIWQRKCGECKKMYVKNILKYLGSNYYSSSVSQGSEDKIRRLLKLRNDQV